MKISVIIPAKDEAKALADLLPSLEALGDKYEIILVDDGSVDGTADLCRQFNKIKTVHHAYPKGNGAAIKSGVRSASGDVLVFMDADGQHNPEDIKKLVDKIEEGYDMVVGSRSLKAHANIFYNIFATWITSHRIQDLTSGLRAIRTKVLRQFLYLLPNGFSYPTTITMAMYRSGYSICYIPVDVSERQGNSHINPFTDGLRFILIIFKVGVLYAPLKIFALTSLLFFISGLGYYFYTFTTQSRFTNMSMLLFISSIIILLIGMISEQLTVLLYSSSKEEYDKNES